MQKDVLFCDKQKCLDSLPAGHIAGNWKYSQYFHCENYKKYIKLIKSYSNPYFFEFINCNNVVKLFFDVEIYFEKNPDLYGNGTQVIEDVAAIYGNNYLHLA